MKFQKFGRTGLTVSRICFGTGTFGKQTEEAEAHRMLGVAADAGVNFIDTADIYPPGGSLGSGESEIITGRWLGSRRSHFILGTKGSAPMGPAAWDRGNSRKHLLDAIDGSLRRLKTDYIDLYSLHLDDLETPLEETVRVMEDMIRSGRTRYIGVSNFMAYRLAKALGLQDTLKMTRFVCVQPRYNLLFREVERDLFRLTMEEQIAVTPYNPLAGGLLTGKYSHDARPTTGRFSNELGGVGRKYSGWYWDERKFATVRRVQGLAVEHAVPLPTLSIAWILAHPAVTAVVIGASRIEHLGDTLTAADYGMTGKLKTQLDEISLEHRRGDTDSEQPQAASSASA